MELLLFRFAASRRSGQDYFILLILTDGIITDMPQTMEAVVNVSMPLGSGRLLFCKIVLRGKHCSLDHKWY